MTKYIHNLTNLVKSRKQVYKSIWKCWWASLVDTTSSINKSLWVNRAQVYYVISRESS